ncbi:hypothetical protein AVEN_51095-1 [Araneus ventricosus]|uniref:Uncharacterized protein n=1 Tax=Araneus ventricosus TaxID=182803 RepID=A0A4Y2Q9L2_ARAVE|nr:hypothetical protein AVEN_51095-1 [Araneus ventricosus]
MLSDGVILLHGNTHTARKIQELLQNFKREVWSHPHPIQPRFGIQSGSEILYGTRFSSDSDVKTATGNWLNGQGRDFYQVELNKLVLRSDKCLNVLAIMCKSDWQVCLLIPSCIFCLLLIFDFLLPL